MSKSVRALAVSFATGASVAAHVLLLPHTGLFPTPDESEDIGYQTELIGGGDIMEPLNESENPIVYVSTR